MRNVLITTAIAAAVALSGCEASESTSEKQERQRDNLMTKADRQVPVPNIDNFVTREQVAEYMERMDMPNKLFYTYIVADTGNVLGYYVSRGAPVNICTFLTPPDRVEDRPGRNPDVVRQAPANDGLYYGSGACDLYYLFDSETDSMVMVKGTNLIVSEQPMTLDAEPIKVKSAD